MKLIFPVFFLFVIYSFLSCNTDPAANIFGKPLKTEREKVITRKLYYNLKGDHLVIEAISYSIAEVKPFWDTLTVEDHNSARIPKKTDTSEYPIASRTGQQLKVFLPEMTVWLQPVSMIIVRRSAGKLVSLGIRGEAYIENQLPVTVKINDSLRVEGAAGSNFNISNYREIKHSEVSLAKGSIKLVGKDELGYPVNSTIEPGDIAVFTRPPGIIATDKMETRKIGSWKEAGDFNFDGIYFSSVLHKLSYWYNTPIVYKQPENDFSITLALPCTTPLDSALYYLHQVHPVKFNWRNDTVYVQ